MKQILYDDFSYILKRETLRNFYKSNPKEAGIIDNVITSINKNLNIKPIYLERLLVDGFIAFEKHFYYDECLSVGEIDPVRLTPHYDSTKREYWIFDSDKDFTKRIFYDNQLIYIVYKDDDNGLNSLSLAEFLYKGKELISPIIERKIINKFKNIDKKLLQ